MNVLLKPYFYDRSRYQKKSNSYKHLPLDDIDLGISDASMQENDWYMQGKCLVYNTPGRSIEFTFQGDEFSVIFGGGTVTGKFRVCIDGSWQTPVDTYRNPIKYRNYVSYQELAQGEHTVQIECLSEKNELSTGTLLIIDGILYHTADKIAK